VLEMDRRAPRRRIMRLLAVGIAVLMLTAAYLLALSRFHVSEVPSERNFAAAGDGAEPAGEVYLEPLSIDALNDAILIRAHLMPVSSASKDTYAGPGKDLTAFIIHDKTVEEVKLTAAEHVATSTFEVDLNEGSVSQYPLDSYAAELAVDLMDAKSSLKVPVQVTVWEACSATDCIRPPRLPLILIPLGSRLPSGAAAPLRSSPCVPMAPWSCSAFPHLRLASSSSPKCGKWTRL
jgi:Domain of unknown function (DUF4436)